VAAGKSGGAALGGTRFVPDVQPRGNDEDARSARTHGGSARLCIAPPFIPVGAADDGGARGWIMLPDSELPMRKGDPLLIVQHPDGSPMKLALDTDAILGVNADRTRVSATPCCSSSSFSLQPSLLGCLSTARRELGPHRAAAIADRAAQSNASQVGTQEAKIKALTEGLRSNSFPVSSEISETVPDAVVAAQAKERSSGPPPTAPGTSSWIVGSPPALCGVLRKLFDAGLDLSAADEGPQAAIGSDGLGFRASHQIEIWDVANRTPSPKLQSEVGFLRYLKRV
jgi:hypothetical protein